ncbi:MAG: hypothetical protein JWL73_2410 [Actinomycetia bacterium]|nr:hypothetical protein [Actinomycetes bacterium]
MEPAAADQPDPTIDAYRRRIRVVAVGEDRIDGELADDLHHFRVVLHHDGSVVTGIDSESVRYPWTTCPGAATELLALVGAPLEARTGSAAKHADARANCTHMFDLASLAMTQAWRWVRRDPGLSTPGADAARERQYDVEISTERDDEHCVPMRLWRDGQLVIEWRLQNPSGSARAIVSPEPYASVPFERGFFRWTATELDPDAGEAAFVLRRACDISRGRGMDLDNMPVSVAFAENKLGVCYAKQAGMTANVRRNLGATRDFASRPEMVFDDR